MTKNSSSTRNQQDKTAASAQTEKRKSAEEDVKFNAAVYVEACASHLLIMRAEEKTVYEDFPLGAMATGLELFVQLSPLLMRSDLEHCLPYALIHRYGCVSMCMFFERTEVS
jgi:hypothetical protein